MLHNNQLFSGSSDKTIKIWSLDTLECVQTLPGHTDGVNVVIPMGNDKIVSGSNDNTAKVPFFSLTFYKHI